MEKANKVKQDLYVGAGFLIFSSAYFVATFFFKLAKTVNTINAAFFPRILGIGSFLLALGIFLRGIKGYKALTPEEKSAFSVKSSPKAIIRVLLCIAVLLTTAAVLRKLGFILTMPFTMFSLFLLVNKKENWKIGFYLVLSVVLPIVLFFVFYYGFSSLLPMGVLKPFLSEHFL